MKKNFCIVGLGIVGKSLLSFYTDFPEQLALFLNRSTNSIDSDAEWNLLICEDRPLTEEEIDRCTELHIIHFTKKEWDKKKDQIDCTWFSTGINQTEFPLDDSKIIKEVDLFQFFWTEPIISITGTYGKTTTTQLIKELFSIDSCVDKKRDTTTANAPSFYNNCTHLSGCSYRRIGLAGNIGKGLLDLVPHQPLLHAAVIELSSWQLEKNKEFAPQIGIWLNLSENHLDRHGSLEAYFAAKASFLNHQTSDQIALLDETLLTSSLRPLLEAERKNWKANIFFVFTRTPDANEFDYLKTQNYGALFIEKNILYQQKNHIKKALFSIETIPQIGFLQSWIFALAAAHFMEVDCTMFSENDLREAYQKTKEAIGGHRLEAIACEQGITFYNDSKSTIQQTTKAAVAQLATTHKKIALILGGLAKGADRSSLVTFALSHPQITYVATFGPGAEDLKGLTHFATLDLVMEEIKTKKDHFDAVLFSPSGSSYDLYKDYKARGEHFKTLAKNL